MDCYSVESEFIESLDFLSPPVKRPHTSREFGSVYTEANDVHLLRGLRNKFARRASSSTKNIKPIKPSSDSSPSLILKKTSERQILEHYSIVSYTSLQRPEDDTLPALKAEKSPPIAEKPLIKVTVIPKTDQTETAKLLRRRRYEPKKVLSTTSNHENSVQTKNVYLIVAGRRREKIYEIKTTGSAKLSTDHDSFINDDEIPIKELSNFKHLIQSLNMDRKKKKERKEKKSLIMDNSDAPQQTSVEWKYPSCQDCLCGDESNESPKKSRVKIFGQFGISEDEKYVLRYGATINDKQVLSDVAQLTRDFSPIIATTSYGTNDAQPTLQKDSCIQADYDVSYEKPPVVEIPSCSKESQGTQVNFNVQCSVAMTKGKKSSSFLDKKVQCSYSFDPSKSEHNNLKDCQSPLVIISVYPKSSPADTVQSVNSPDTIGSASPTRMATYTSNQVTKTERGMKRNNNETKRKSPAASRSPSPTKKIKDESVKTQVIEKRSPDRHKALKAIKEKIQEKDTKLKRDPSPRKPPTKSNTANSTQVAKNLQNITVSNATQASKKNPLQALSNATQVSNKNNQMYQASNGTQVSVRRRQTYTSNATQYSDGQQSVASNGTQSVDNNITDSVPEMAPVKHSRNVVASPSLKYPKKPSPIRFPRTAQVSNATQVPKSPQFFASNGTQVSERVPIAVSKSNGTQVSKIKQKPFSSRLFRNQETYTLPNASQVYEDQQYARISMNRINDMGTNTDHHRTKRTIIETYTKQLTDQMSQKDSIPAKYNNSKVTINIDGDGEYYDVLFNQDQRSTDLTIRKKLKDAGSQKYYDLDQEHSASLENLMYVPEIIVEKETSNPQNDSHSKSLSFNNNPSDDEYLLDNDVSRLTIRDSLEISHRREDKVFHNNIKNTQTCFTAQIATTVPDATEFLAPIKHFIGDDCSITDPVERDKQIRQLLGVDKLKQSFTESQQAGYSENSSHIPYHCIYRKECKNSELTEINFEFQKVCPCFKSRHAKNKASVSVQCRQPPSAKKHEPHSYYSVIDTCGQCEGPGIPIPLAACSSTKMSGINLKTVRRPKKDPKKEKSAIYQQLILNRNIQVFLQVDQFSKQKPIILSRKQYDKVKKTIQKTICIKKSSHEKRRNMPVPVKREKRDPCLDYNSSEISLKVKSKSSKRQPNKRNKQYNAGKPDRRDSPEMYGRYASADGNFERSEIYDKSDKPEMYGKRDKPMAHGKHDMPEFDDDFDEICSKRDKHKRPEPRKHGTSGKRDKSGKREKYRKREKSDKCFKSSGSDHHEKSEVPRKRDKSPSSVRHERPKVCDSREVTRKRQKSVTSGKRTKSVSSSKHEKSGSSEKGDKSVSSGKRHQPEENFGEEPKFPEKQRKSDVSIGAVRTKKQKEKGAKEIRKKSTKIEKSAQVEATCSVENCKTNIDERIWGHPPKSKLSKNNRKSKEQMSTDYFDKKKKPKQVGNVEVFKIDNYDENSPFAAGDDDRTHNKKHERNGVWSVEKTSTPIIQQRHAECLTNLDVGTGGDMVHTVPSSSTSEQAADPDRLSEQRSPSVYECSNDIQDQSLVECPYNDSMDVEHQETEMKTFVLFNADNVDDTKDADFDGRTRKTMSSVEIRYASVAYMKQVAYSSTDVGALSNSSPDHVKSFHTIFRGHRKSATPNLGTSAYSLYTEEGYNSENKSVKYIIEPRDSKPKRPFLRRLMSCLVMRSARDSELKLPTGPAIEDPLSVNSSIDSYHISTSLGAMEISSSIYDTSASFYSNHTILPVNSKIKRGFFSSVRGFLTNRKS